MKKQRKSNENKVIHLVILSLITAFVCFEIYTKVFFGNESVDEFYFYITHGAKNGDLGMYWNGIKFCIPVFIALMALVYSIFYNVLVNKSIYISIKGKKHKIYPFDIVINHRKLFTYLFAFLSIIAAIYNYRITRFFASNIIKSTFIEDNYVMEKDDVKFNEKRNLIYIVVESLETTFFTKDQGGNWDYEVIPELYDILNDSDTYYFSGSSKAGGLLSQYGGSWTTSAIISNNTGLPLKVHLSKAQYQRNNYMNGAYALGDLLKDNGYYNEVISAARANFGGIEEFYLQHGNYKIVDIDTLKSFGYDYDESDLGVWGFNDKYLFEVSKKRVEEAAKKDQPFNIAMITIDTHPNDGFVGDYTVNKYDEQFDNVYATTSALLGDFIKWVKEQDFYKDTTIVIVGDHLNMQTEYFKGRDTNRYIYNAFINPAVKPKKTKNRKAMAIDMYPSTVAAIGGEISSNRLGLGTNLFSDEETLAEEYGEEELNKQLSKKSEFYNTKILGLKQKND